jgi:hypothetical protein
MTCRTQAQLKNQKYQTNQHPLSMRPRWQNATVNISPGHGNRAYRHPFSDSQKERSVYATRSGQMADLEPGSHIWLLPVNRIREIKVTYPHMHPSALDAGPLGHVAVERLANGAAQQQWAMTDDGPQHPACHSLGSRV